MLYIYDIETYINYFGVIFKNPKTQETKEFIVYKDRNDLPLLRQFIAVEVRWLVGYNNFYFDNQLINYICQDNNATVKDIYDLANTIVNSREEFYGYKYKLPFQSIDLMKVGNLQKSLKLVAVNLKWPKIQDLPLPWNTTITDEHLELMHKYNLNDVEITEALYNKLLPEIKVRSETEKLYNVNLISESDSGMANRLMEKFYSEITGLHKRDFKDLRTERKIVNFRSVIFEDIVFQTTELQGLLEEFKSHVYYENMPFFNKTVTYGGTKYKLGIGGIHSVDKGAIFEADDENELIDADIASMYPMVIINNRLKPHHLDRRFIDKYAEIVAHRLEAKKDGRKTEAYALKILANSVYGKFRNANHWLYDPRVALQVTINGQLYVLMLIEDLTREGFQVISANTDGIVTIVPKNRKGIYNRICSDWEIYTKFDLEFTNYSKYIRRDVNNYLTIKPDGDTKAKGEFLLSEDKSLMQGFDKPIISIALRKYFLEGKSIVDTIQQHNDIYDFCVAKKTDKKFSNEYHTINKEGELDVKKLQKSIRFYIATQGGALYKYSEEDDKYIAYCSKKNVRIFNDYVELPMEEYKIDYNYYISETQKIINLIEDRQLKLF